MHISYTHTHTHTYTHIHIHTYTYTYTHINTQMYTITHTYILPQTCHVPIITASNLNPGMRMTTSRIGWDPAPDKVQHTTSDFSTHTKHIIKDRVG